MSEQAKQVAPLDLQAIKERVAKATPGPWTYDRGNEDNYPAVVKDGETLFWFEGVGCDHGDEDIDFMSHAREDIPALVAEVEKETERANIAEMELSWLWRQVQEAHDLVDTDPQAALEKLRYVMAQTEEDTTDETRD